MMRGVYRYVNPALCYMGLVDYKYCHNNCYQHCVSLYNRPIRCLLLSILTHCTNYQLMILHTTRTCMIAISILNLRGDIWICKSSCLSHLVCWSINHKLKFFALFKILDSQWSHHHSYQNINSCPINNSRIYDVVFSSLSRRCCCCCCVCCCCYC